MPINFTCPHCGHQTSVDEQFVGQRGPCAGCGREVTVAAAGGGNAAPPSGASAAPAVVAGSAVAIVAILAVVGVAVLCVVGLLVALLLPAVQAARESARSNACRNNLRQIGLALHGYHDAFGMLPPAYTTDTVGQPLHSWRVLILPFMERQDLYARVDLSKPWDAPENAFLAREMPSQFSCPSDPNGQSSETHYAVIVGDEAVFRANAGLSLSELTAGDGSGNTILVVESTDAFTWYEPRDLNLDEMSFDINDPSGGGIGSFHSAGANAVFGDISVRFLGEDSLPPEAVRGLLTPGGGEAVEMEY